MAPSADFDYHSGWPMLNQIKLYLWLTKPGVLFGNAITTVAGFLLASAGQVNLWLLTTLFCGTSLVIASACAANNALDRDIDQHMSRTKQRAVAAGQISVGRALLFAALLAGLGLAVLTIYTNWLVVMTGVLGWVCYVWLYGAWSKRRSVYGTLVGAVSGALPIVAGYLAVANRLDAAVVLLFVSLLVWQLPEFYSIGIYRRDEYQAAGVPILPVVKGVARTKKDIFVATLIFVVSSCLLTPLGYTGYVYLIVMLAAGLYWLWLGWQGLKAEDSEAWARRMFKFALIMLLLYSAMISIGPLLP
jgi:protoheme IX farnesyltransferase